MRRATGRSGSTLHRFLRTLALPNDDGHARRLRRRAHAQAYGLYADSFIDVVDGF